MIIMMIMIVRIRDPIQACYVENDDYDDIDKSVTNSSLLESNSVIPVLYFAKSPKLTSIIIIMVIIVMMIIMMMMMKMLINKKAKFVLLILKLYLDTASNRM